MALYRNVEKFDDTYNPDTLSRYLSASGPTENDEYSAEYHSPVSRWI